MGGLRRGSEGCFGAIDLHRLVPVCPSSARNRRQERGVSSGETWTALLRMARYTLVLPTQATEHATGLSRPKGQPTRKAFLWSGRR